jgi:hypothetical protein
MQVTPVPGLSADGGVDVLVASYWESIPLYEAWRNNSAAITAHLPNGTYQYVPKKGEGFPGGCLCLAGDVSASILSLLCTYSR